MALRKQILLFAVSGALGFIVDGGIVQLLDVRHDPTNDDRQMLDFLGDLGVPTIVVLTKVDKLRASERKRRLIELPTSLGLDDDQVIPFSAVTGEGRRELAEAIESLLAQPSWRAEEEAANTTDSVAADGSDASRADALPDTASPDDNER